MDKHAIGALVTGYEKLIHGLSLPDENDRHVLAAAIHAGASVIVTTNLKDFPLSRIRKFGIRAQPPDEFLLRLIALDPSGTGKAADTHRQSLKNPAMTVAQYLTMLEVQGIPQFVNAVRDMLI
jgi:hypothetical protein